MAVEMLEAGDASMLNASMPQPAATWLVATSVVTGDFVSYVLQSITRVKIMGFSGRGSKILDSGEWRGSALGS